MRDSDFKEHVKEGHHRGDRHKRKDHEFHHRGAKTFRRGRALAFLEMMNIKRTTLKQQLEAPEFQSIQQILIGELKALDMVINEFVQVFEIHEFEEMEKQEDIETAPIATEDSQENKSDNE